MAVVSAAQAISQIALLVGAIGCGRVEFDLLGDARVVDGGASAPCPVAWWPMDEGQGGTTTDAANGAAPGALVGPVWDSGMTGSALRFDGLDDYVSVGGGDGAVLDLPDALSICAWFNSDDVTKDQVLVAHSAAGGTGYIQYVLQLNDGQGNAPDNNARVTFGWANGSGNYALWYTAAGTFTSNTWHHVCANRLDVTTVELVVDGVATALFWNQVTAVPDDGTRMANAALGMLDFNNGTVDGLWQFDGRMDDVRIYDRALLETEIELVRSRAPVACP